MRSPIRTFEKMGELQSDEVLTTPVDSDMSLSTGSNLKPRSYLRSRVLNNWRKKMTRMPRKKMAYRAG